MKLSVFELLQPVGLQKARKRYANYRKESRVKHYWASRSEAEIHSAVDSGISLIASLTDDQTRDAAYLETELIPRLGLNNEMLHEQPVHLKDYYGKGLHIWQYPIQFAPFLAWLAANGASIKKHLEIGVRWGGTFIAVSEFLRRVSPGFERSIAVDPIEPSPLMRRYLELGRADYHQGLSTDTTFSALLDAEKPDFVFIDGDHTMRGVMHDFEVCSRHADLIAFHDVRSDGCLDTTLFWSFLQQHATKYESCEFVEQYDSVEGGFMGIGVLLRKEQVDVSAYH